MVDFFTPEEVKARVAKNIEMMRIAQAAQDEGKAPQRPDLPAPVAMDSLLSQLEGCQRGVCEALGGTWSEDPDTYGCIPPDDVNLAAWTLWYAAEIQVCNPIWGWVTFKPAPKPKDPNELEDHTVPPINR